MSVKLVFVCSLVFALTGSVSAQKEFYVYPPLCDSVINEAAFAWDSSFVRIDCEILSNSVDTLYVMENLVNSSSVPGWIIIYSFWDQGNEDEFIKLEGIDRRICLSNVDSGYETSTNPTDTTSIKGVYARRRPIAIINSFTCDVYYLESKDLFKLYVWDEDFDDE